VNIPSNTPSTPADTSKYQPKFVLDQGAVLGEFKTGVLNRLSLDIKNDSTHTAKNMKVTLMKGSEVFPITVEGATISNLIKVLNGSKSDQLEYKFYINSAAAPKTYDLILNIEYENAYGDDFTQTIPVYLNVDNNALQPIVGVVNTEVEGGFVGSDSPSKIRLTVKNGGTIKAQKVIIQLKGMLADGLRLEHDLDTKQIGTMGSNMTGIAEFNMIASPTATGVQTLTAVLTYYDEMGQTYERNAPVYIETGTSSSSVTDLQVEFDQSNYVMTESAKKSIRLTVTNHSEKLVKDLKLTLSSDASLKFLTPYVQFIQTINPGESKEIVFDAMLGQNIQANTYPLYITYNSSTGTEASQRINVAGIQVIGEQTGSKPKIIIEGYEYGEESILAGDTYNLTIRFKNTSSSMGIRNAKVTYTAEEGVFIPVDAANSFFIEKIGAGEVVEKVLTLKTKADGKVKMYGIDFKVEYEDQNGNSYDEKDNPYVAQETISVNVKQEIRLEIADIFLPFEAYVGTPIQVDAQFFNMGKSIMYNMMVKLEGNFQAQDGNYFVGNFDPGREDYFSGTMFPSEPGLLEGRLLFVFEDETGVKQEIEKPIQINVLEQDGFIGVDGEYPDGEYVDGEFPEVPDGENGEKIGFKMPIWAWVILVLVAIGLVTIVLKMRKKKRIAQLLEDEDENE
jgi:hypothetical protein